MLSLVSFQAVVGAIVWAFHGPKKPRCREMNARGYALHSVCPQLSFFNCVPYHTLWSRTQSSAGDSSRWYGEHSHEFVRPGRTAFSTIYAWSTMPAYDSYLRTRDVSIPSPTLGRCATLARIWPWHGKKTTLLYSVGLGDDLVKDSNALS